MLKRLIRVNPENGHNHAPYTYFRTPDHTHEVRFQMPCQTPYLEAVEWKSAMVVQVQLTHGALHVVRHVGNVKDLRKKAFRRSML